jgi:hypothetical protein
MAITDLKELFNVCRMMSSLGITELEESQLQGLFGIDPKDGAIQIKKLEGEDG